jgi:predicted TPR repeat methyltransferase
MAKYHKYVFDLEKRTLLGNFEKMYQDESKENFDSWHQDDIRQLPRKICLDILEDYNFQKIIDIGCGKGSLTQLLKKKNNQVIAVDISKTAISIARERFPDIDFVSTDVNDTKNYALLASELNGVDLLFSSQVFSYIENWKKLLVEISNSSEYLMIVLFIPENPIGFIKSGEELAHEISKSFVILEHVNLQISQHHIIFAKRRKSNEF